MARSIDQTEEWQLIYSAYLADTASLASFTELDQRRREILPEMNNLLGNFVAGNISVHEFNTAFQQKTHNRWNVFGVRGLSGGMFLNKLTKYITQEKYLTQQLCAALQVPIEASEAWKRMQAFYEFLGMVQNHVTL